MATQNTPAFSEFGTLSDLAPEKLLKRYLAGINVVDDNGDPWPNEFYEYHLQQAVNEFTKETKVRVIKKVITDEKHDYHIADYLRYAFLKLDEFPIISVEQVRGQFPTSDQSITFPSQWVKIHDAGQIQLVPTSGTISQFLIGQGGAFLPMVLNGAASILPQFWHVDYTVGFDPAKIPWDVIDCIHKLAAIEVLTVVADTLWPPGATSLSSSIDGMSQSVGIMNNGNMPPVWSGRIRTYRAELFGGMGVGDAAQLGKLARIQKEYKGVNFVVA